MTGGPAEDYARLIVSGARRGDSYVKFPSWYDIFLLYKVFAPNILNWTLRILLSTHGSRRTSPVGIGRPLLDYNGRPLLEGTSPSKFVACPTHYAQFSPQQVKKE